MIVCFRGSSASAPAARNEYDDGTAFCLLSVSVAAVCSFCVLFSAFCLKI